MKSSTVGIILENTRTLFIWIETIIASVIAVKKKNPYSVITRDWKIHGNYLVRNCETLNITIQGVIFYICK